MGDHRRYLAAADTVFPLALTGIRVADSEILW